MRRPGSHGLKQLESSDRGNGGYFGRHTVYRVRKLEISEAKEIRDFLLREFRSPKGRTVRVLRRKSFKSSQRRYSGSPRLTTFGLSAGAIFRVPQAEKNWG